MMAIGQSHVVTGMGSGSGCSLDVPQTPPPTHPGGWSQELGTMPQHDAGGGVWDFLFPDERRQGPGGSGSGEVLEHDHGTGPVELHSRGWCAPTAQRAPGPSVTASAGRRGSEAPPEGQPSTFEVANVEAEDGNTSSVMQCKGVYRITVKGAARHGRGCCMGT